MEGTMQELLLPRFLLAGGSREAVMLLSFASLLVLFWTASVLHRSASEEMRRWVWLISAQLLGWNLLCLLQELTDPATGLGRVLWYGNAVFLMGLPLGILYAGVAIDYPPGEEKQLPGWFRCFLWLFAAMLVLVATNDVHGAVLRYLPDRKVGRLGIGYVLVYFFSGACLAASLCLLIRKSRSSPRPLEALPAQCLVVLMTGYVLGRGLGDSRLREVSLPLMFCGFSVFYLQSILRTGLIPSNTRYQDLFSLSPLHMQLMNGEGETVLRSVDAPELTREQRQRILSQPETPFYQDRDTLVHSQQIHGGIALWQEDVGELSRLQDQLQESIEKLRATNALLHQQSQVRRQKLVSEVKNQIYDQLESEIRPETQALSGLIRDIRSGTDREKQTLYLPLLLCHLKRKCNLFFLSHEGKHMSSNELTVYLDELSEFASYGQIHALVRCGISGELPVHQGILCYDFYFSLLTWALRDSGAVLIGQIHPGEGQLEFGVLVSEDTGSLNFSREFLQELEAAGGTISHKSVEESQSLCLTIPGEAEI